MATMIRLRIEDLNDDSSSYSSLPRKVPLGLGECETCFIDTELVWTRRCCKVKICQACLQTYVDGKIDDGVIDIQCPGHNCDTFLNKGIIKGAVDTVKAKRFSFLRVKSDKCKYKKACPLCDNVINLDDTFLQFYDNLESIIVCPNPKCLKEWCFQCMVPWHEGLTCAEFKSQKTDTGVDKWAKQHQSNDGERNAQQCPNCKAWIQKIVGCYFMTCKECKTNFCYDCGVRTPHPKGSKCKQAGTGVHGENNNPRPAIPRPAAPRLFAPRPAAAAPQIGRNVPIGRFQIQFQEQRLARLRDRGDHNRLTLKVIDFFTVGRRDILWYRCAIVFVFTFICFIGILAHGMIEAYVRPWDN